jgi:hypothetical protein
MCLDPIQFSKMREDTLTGIDLAGGNDGDNNNEAEYIPSNEDGNAEDE